MDSSIAYRYATAPLLPSICYPVTMSFITSVHYVIMASVSLCHYVFRIILSVILDNIM